jgi:hypothetical protein
MLEVALEIQEIFLMHRTMMKKAFSDLEIWEAI